MCIEDIRLGRQIQHAETNINVLNANLPVVQSNHARVYLVFWPPIAGTINLTTQEPALATTGIQLTPTSHPLVLDIKTHGKLVCRNWFAISDAAGGRNLSIHEGTLLVE